MPRRLTGEANALDALHTVERVARQVGVADRLHLWPDESLGSQAAIKSVPNPTQHEAWLQRCWQRISKWPKPSRVAETAQSH